MPPTVVGQPEEVVGAQPGLDVLERHVVDRLAVGERVVHVVEHLPRGRADVELLEGDAEGLRQPGRVGLRRLAGREAGHRERVDVAARTTEPVHGTGRDDQRVRRVEAAGDADDHLGLADRVQSLLEPGDLDVVGLVAVERQTLGVVGHEREAVDLAAQADVAARRLDGERDRPEGRGAVRQRPPVVVERPLAEPLLPDPVEVDVGDAAPRPVGEALGLGEQVAHLVDQRLAVPRQVGGRLALAGGGVEVRRQAALRSPSGPAVAGPRHGPP